MRQKLYICYTTKTKNMDLEARKYHFIQELFTIEKESSMDILERVIKHEKEENQEISTANKKELDKRLESYQKNPNDVLDWEAVKKDW
jgi:putative addiction module component (TIGR02574 family)